jgi:hypothetical protein
LNELNGAQILPIAVTICPVVFSAGLLGDEQKNIEQAEPEVGEGLDKLESQSLTLFRELFRVVLSGPFTSDNK